MPVVRDVETGVVEPGCIVDVLRRIDNLTEFSQRTASHFSAHSPELLFGKSAFQLFIETVVEQAHHIVERALLVRFSTYVDVEEQTHDRTLEVVVDAYVARVGVVVHEVQPDVVTRLAKALVALAFIGRIHRKISGEQLQRLVGCCDAGIAEQAEFVVARQALAHPQHRRDGLLVVVDGPEFGGTDTLDVVKMEVLMSDEGEKLHFGAATAEVVRAIGVASLRVQVLQSAAASAHVDEAVEGVGHVAHQLGRCRDNLAEVALQVHLVGPVGCLHRKLILATFVLELFQREVADQQRRVVERVEVGSTEGCRIVRPRPQPRGDVLPFGGHPEGDGDRMPQVAVNVHEHPRRCHEGHLAAHPAGSHVALVGIDTVGNYSAATVRQRDAPAVHAVLTPGEAAPCTIGSTEVTEVLGEVKYLVVARCPARHVQHQFRIPLTLIVESYVQIVACRVGCHRVVHLVGWGFAPLSTNCQPTDSTD